MNNEIYTSTICEPSGDTPGWMIAAIFAIPILLVLADAIGGCR